METREAILRNKPANRAHWIALAVAYYLVNDLTQALGVISSYYSIIGASARGGVASEGCGTAVRCAWRSRKTCVVC